MDRKSPWRQKLDVILNTCQDEIKKTVVVGKKMLTAGKENSELSLAYEKLGKKVFKALKKGTLTWEDEKVQQLIKNIEAYKKNLEQIELEVQKIKSSKN